MQKNASPSKAQAAVIRAYGLNPENFTVIKDLNFSLFIRHRVTGLVKMIPKRL